MDDGEITSEAPSWWFIHSDIRKSSRSAGFLLKLCWIWKTNNYSRLKPSGGSGLIIIITKQQACKIKITMCLKTPFKKHQEKTEKKSLRTKNTSKTKKIFGSIIKNYRNIFFFLQRCLMFNAQISILLLQTCYTRHVHCIHVNVGNLRPFMMLVL